MKLTTKTYIGLAISSVLLTNANAGPFRDALQNGKLTGEIRNVLALGSKTDALNEAGPLNNTKSGSSSIEIKYETAAYSGLKFGIGFQHGKDWGIHDEASGPSVTGGEDDSRNTISATNLQQAYLDYSFDPSLTKTSFRIGRQDIISPLIMRSSMFPMKDAFDAVVITNNDLPATTVKLMYVKNWIKRYGNDANTSPVQTDIHLNDPLYVLYLNNKSVPGLDIEAQWLSNEHTGFLGDPPTAVPAIGPYDTQYLGLNYKIPNAPVVLGAKYLNADMENSVDTNYWGVKAQTTLSDVTVRLAYTSVDDDANFPGTLGHVPQFKAYADTNTDAEFIAGVDTTSLTVGYNFGLPNLKASLVYASWSQSDEGIANTGPAGRQIDLDGGSEVGLDVKYNFQSVKGLNTRVQLSRMDYDKAGSSEDDLTYLRWHMNYKF